jgi:GntR family transcriptional regulator, carbon starvation induced regulator
MLAKAAPVKKIPVPINAETAEPPAKRRNRPGRTQTTDVFEVLRHDILHCRLAPGVRLRFKELRERYNSGLSPLREALMRLATDGLVILEDHKGFRVAPVSQDEMVDIASTLFELEAIAIRFAIEKGDDRWEANILARFHELSKRPMLTPDGALDEEWEARNVAFHESLYAASGSPHLILFCRMLSERRSRYRRLWARHANPQREVAKEHESIMRAVVNRELGKAVELLRKHRTSTTSELLANWDPDFTK